MLLVFESNNDTIFKNLLYMARLKTKRKRIFLAAAIYFIVKQDCESRTFVTRPFVAIRKTYVVIHILKVI